MNNITNLDSKRCYGCSACKSACPSQAISMEIDQEGFLTPCILPEKCINCGICEKCCTLLYVPDLNTPINCYAAVTKNDTLYQTSSSGGIFATIAEAFIAKGGFVCGASMQNDYKVQHIIIKNVEDLELIQGSKYVQSDTSEVYDKIIQILKSNKKVLFSGTPCQVAGLIKLVKQKNMSLDNLYTIDIICHGVPSPQFLQDHIKHKYGEVSNLRFRHRTKHELNCFALGFIKNGKFKMIYPSDRDFYYACFSSMVSLRESCYTCGFSRMERVGDLTLGDMNSHKRYENKLGNNKAISVVLTNTSKGDSLFHSVKNIDFVKADYVKEAELNTQLKHPSPRPIGRDDFYRILYQDGYNEDKVKRYGKKYSLKEKIKIGIILFTTQRFRKKLQGYLGMLKS